MNERAQLLLAFAAFIAIAYGLMFWGWRNRKRRQQFLPVPVTAVSGAEPLGEPVSGLLVGTTFTGRWLDRVAVHGLSNRTLSDLTLAVDGVHLTREGADELFVPWADVEDAQPGSGLAGKVIGKGGLLLLSWRLGDTSLTTGFRADAHSEHQRLADAIAAHRTSSPVETT